MNRQGLVVSIYPTEEQAQELRKALGAQRWLWNKFLACNIYEHMFTGKFISWEAMCARLPSLKKEEETKWMADIPAQTLQATVRYLARAIRAVWKSGFGFPKFKSRNLDDDSATFPQDCVMTDNGLKLPVIGTIRCLPRNAGKCRRVAKRLMRLQGAAIKTVTITYDRKRRRWFASLSIMKEILPLKRTGRTLGIDVGSVRTYTDSDGGSLEALREFPKVKKLTERIEATQRKLSNVLLRIRNGETVSENGRRLSALRNRFSKTLRALHRKLADFCRDILHKESRKIVEGHDFIVVENLNLKGMTKSAKGTVEEPGSNVAQKSGLNRNLLSNRLGMFLAMLEYKCGFYSKTFLRVNPRFTSQTCPKCGHTSSENRKTQAEFRCVRCGYFDNADHNAAVNILYRGLPHATAAAGSGSL